jgi:hypothetical protein
LGLALLGGLVAPARPATPAQQAAAAARARTDAAARARFDAEAKARASAQAVARARVDAGIAAQKKAAVEVFLRSQESARAKAYARSGYVVANAPRHVPPAQARIATAPAAKPLTHQRPAAALAHQAHPTTSHGHGR